MTFARQLQRHQKRLGYTDAQMCAALDVGDSTYRSWRNADPKRTHRVNDNAEVSHAVGVGSDDLLGARGKTPSKNNPHKVAK